MTFTRICILLPAILMPWCASGQPPGAQLPDAPNRETVQRICSSCHPAQIVLGRGMTREQWGGIVSNMISRGAKGSDEEFAEVVDYLAKNLPPAKEGTRRRQKPRRRAPET